MPVEKRFQGIRLEAVRLSGERVVFDAFQHSSPICNYRIGLFRHAFIMNDPPLQYYLHQARRGSNSGMGPLYSVPPLGERGHGMCSFLSDLFRLIRPVLWRGFKAVEREAMRTGGKILSNLADNRSGDVKPRQIISKLFSDSAHNLIQEVRGNGRKRSATLESRVMPSKRR